MGSSILASRTTAASAKPYGQLDYPGLTGVTSKNGGEVLRFAQSEGPLSDYVQNQSKGKLILRLVPAEPARQLRCRGALVADGDDGRVAEVDEADDVVGWLEAEERLDRGVVGRIAGPPVRAESETVGGEEQVLRRGRTGGDFLDLHRRRTVRDLDDDGDDDWRPERLALGPLVFGIP